MWNFHFTRGIKKICLYGMSGSDKLKQEKGIKEKGHSFK